RSRSHPQLRAHARRHAPPSRPPRHPRQGRSRPVTTAITPILTPDTIPNRFLSGTDWSDPRYRALMDELAAIYRDEMAGQPHPFGAKNPDAITTHWSREWEYPWAILNAECKPGVRIVDLGCGGSPLLPNLARRAGDRKSVV